MSEITLKNVSKIYENQQYAVRNVNLEIQDKEFVILVGNKRCKVIRFLMVLHLFYVYFSKT